MRNVATLVADATAMTRCRFLIVLLPAPARWLLAAALGGLLALATSAVAAAGRPPTSDELHGVTLAGIAPEPITLAGGAWEAPAAQPGAASRLRVTLWPDPIAAGELEGAPDATAVLLTASGGGSGTFVYVAVLERRGDRLVNTGTALAGDRTAVRSLTIADRRVVVDVVDAGPGDAVCCPSQLVRQSYTLAAGALTLVSLARTGTLSLAMLTGPAWTLVSVDDTPLASDARPPTLAVEGTRVSGFGGCNRYSGEIDDRAPGALALGPLASTKMACPPPATDLEDRYLSALGSVSHYTFDAGRLVLSGVADGTARRLTFERARP
jgi:heat shock protein HslJ